MAETIRVLVGTRKGAFVFKGDAARETWSLEGPHFLGSNVHHIVQDPRRPNLLLMGARTGHLGPTVFRSDDLGGTWTEAERPPRFPKAADGPGNNGQGRVVGHVFWLTPGHTSEPGVWYAATSPHGLFRSADDGLTWDGVAGWNDNPLLVEWTGGDQSGTPDGPKLHSVLIDPRDAAHMYVSGSGGGTFESPDAGATWTPLNSGVAMNFAPPPEPPATEWEYGHDPHHVALHPLRPDRLYQQNHCGIYRIDRPDKRWVRIGDNMPRDIGDIGFPIVLHPRDPDTVWVFPMNGSDVWPRTSPGGRPAAYRSRDAGATWERQDKGLPQQAWWTVKRQSMCSDQSDPLGLYFGTTGGQVWQSRDEGGSWRPMSLDLPHVYCVGVAIS